MSKRELIAAIREQNRSATEQFLRGFGERELHEYLAHLDYGRRPRGRDAVWRRPSDTRAIVVRTVDA